ncbi:MAG: hypothetical protein HUJ65_04010, partial [Oscillospiraceae bacterium]|nr:hypothetical protein [Oscillospiraceae bacterium]
EFLAEMLSAAINAGAKYVTVCDSTGEMLPEELEAFVKGLYNDIPALGNAELCVQCRDSIGLASAAAVAAVGAGAAGLKMTSSPASGFLTMGQITRILQIRGEALGIETELNLGEWQRICRYLEGLTDMNRNGHSAFNSATGSATESETESEELSADADKLTVRRHIVAMGYDVSDDDMEHIYYLFRELAAKKAVSNRDLEAIVAEAAHQVAPSYQLDNYVINSGSTITATAYLRINHEGKPIQTVSIGDGPIDAAFLAIEQAVGHHFELEDFKIRAVTEGREALGEALVKLRSGGKLFSGRGISTDIIGAAIRAYMSAVNKIVYEENNI